MNSPLGTSRPKSAMLSRIITASEGGYKISRHDACEGLPAGGRR